MIFSVPGRTLAFLKFVVFGRVPNRVDSFFSSARGPRMGEEVTRVPLVNPEGNEHRWRTIKRWAHVVCRCFSPVKLAVSEDRTVVARVLFGAPYAAGVCKMRGPYAGAPLAYSVVNFYAVCVACCHA